MKNNNKEFYDYFYKRESNSPTKSGNALWEYYLIYKILKYINKDNIHNVLDVGCGQGHKLFFISKHFDSNVNFTGIDFSKTGIEKANSLYKEFRNINFLQEDINNLSVLKNKKFEIVSLLEVLEHIEDWQAFLLNCLKLSNKYILLSFPTGRMREYEKNIGHYRNFKRGEVERFLSTQGFKPVKTLYSGFPFYTPLARNYIDKNYSNFMKSIEHKFTKKQEIFHYFVYIVFRFFCFDNIGDKFTGLFEKK